MKSKKRRTRKHRRLYRARIRTGKTIVRHKLRSGRTGGVHRKKTRSHQKPPQEAHRWIVIFGKYVRS